MKKQKNRTRHNRACDWCGVGFVASRTDAKTCCKAHRQALARWVKKAGRYPHFPPASSLARAFQSEPSGSFKANRSK